MTKVLYAEEIICLAFKCKWNAGTSFIFDRNTNKVRII